MNTGDVVQLRSGGPLMTVLTVTDGLAHLVWFNSHNEMKDIKLHTDVCIIRNPAPKPV